MILPTEYDPQKLRAQKTWEDRCLQRKYLSKILGWKYVLIHRDENEYIVRSWFALCFGIYSWCNILFIDTRDGVIRIETDFDNEKAANKLAQRLNRHFPEYTIRVLVR